MNSEALLMQKHQFGEIWCIDNNSFGSYPLIYFATILNMDMLFQATT